MVTYVYGFHPVVEILTFQPLKIETLILAKEIKTGKKQKLLTLAQKKAVSVKIRPRIYLDKLLEKTAQKPVHQGIIAVLKEFPYSKLETVINSHLLLALDHIQDPQNLGSIIRSACAFGVDGIILPKDRSASITSSVIKASAGTVIHMPVVRIANLAQTLNKLKTKGFWIVGTVVKDGTPLWDFNPPSPLVVVIGQEQKGLSRLIREKCDFLITIPMQNNIASLNAAVATAVCLYEIFAKIKGHE